MTKKSQSRQQRDRAKKDAVKKEIIKKRVGEHLTNSKNNFYDALENSRTELLRELSRYDEIVLTLQANPNTMSFVEDKTKLANLIHQMDRDIIDLRGKIDTTHAKHQGKTGGTTEMDEHMNVLSLFEEYEKISIIHKDVIAPVAIDISALIDKAEHRMLGELRKMQEAHPEVAEQVFSGLVEEAAVELKQLQDEAEEQTKLEEAQDPTVITDVEVRDANTQDVVNEEKQ